MKWTWTVMVATIGLAGAVSWATIPGVNDGTDSVPDGHCSLDVDRDGVVTAAEVRSAYGSDHAGVLRSAPAGGHALSVSRFRSADVDQDGALNRAEAETSLPMLAQRFDRYDLNRDGQIDSFEIHHQFMVHPPARLRSDDVIERLRAPEADRVYGL